MRAFMAVLITVNVEDGHAVDELCLDLDRETTKVVNCDTNETIGTMQSYETVSIVGGNRLIIRGRLSELMSGLSEPRIEP